MASSSPDLDQVLAFAISLARECGDRIKTGSEARFKTQAGSLNEKKNSVDLVTETDQAVEAHVKASIQEKYPSHRFIGEEETSAGERPALTDEPTWIVDPVDGTTNFVHGFPHCCISIGFTVGGKPVVGVVYNPFLDQLFSAAQGRGAFLNESQRLPLVSPPPAIPSISSALLGVEWGSDRSEAVMERKLKSFSNLVGEKGAMVRGMRSLGSAALNFCAVASGQLDAYWEIGCWEWDVCGGAIIAQEAGGRLFGSKESSLDGEPTADVLTGRKYLVVRGGAGGLEEQKKLARSFYSYVEEWDQV